MAAPGRIPATTEPRQDRVDQPEAPRSAAGSDESHRHLAPALDGLPGRVVTGSGHF